MKRRSKKLRLVAGITLREEIGHGRRLAFFILSSSLETLSVKVLQLAFIIRIQSSLSITNLRLTIFAFDQYFSGNAHFFAVT